MASVRKIAGKLRGLFRRDRPAAGMPGLAGKRPGKVVGHRGVATGLPPDTEQWELIPGGEVEDFVYKERVLKVHSSNVDSVQYLHDQGKLIIAYHSGGVYEYSNISEQDAINFAQALSKGRWTWDNLRVRGSRTEHKKPFRRLR